MTTHYSEYNPTSPIQRVRIRSAVNNNLLREFEASKTLKKDGCEFDIMHLKEGYGREIVEEIFFDSHVIEAARLHCFTPEQYAAPHFDSGYDGLDTIIVRLDDCLESRLKIEGIIVPEHEAVGYVLPSGTIHEVTMGENDRYTLTVWGRKR